MKVSTAEIKYVDYHELIDEVEKRLGYNVRGFHKYYLDNIHLVEEMKEKYIEERKKPYISSYPKHFDEDLVNLMEQTYTDSLENQFLNTRVGNLLKEDAHHYLDFWHAVLDVVTHDGFNRDGYTCLNLDALPPWTKPIKDCIFEILEGTDVIWEDYYEARKLFFYTDW